MYLPKPLILNLTTLLTSTQVICPGPSGHPLLSIDNTKHWQGTKGASCPWLTLSSTTSHSKLSYVLFISLILCRLQNWAYYNHWEMIYVTYGLGQWKYFWFYKKICRPADVLFVAQLTTCLLANRASNGDPITSGRSGQCEGRILIQGANTLTKGCLLVIGLARMYVCTKCEHNHFYAVIYMAYLEIRKNKNS